MRVTAGVLIVGLTAASPARAQTEDPWLGRDKALHFGVSAALAGAGYALGIALFDCELPRLVLGGSVALGLGVGKELWDLAGDGDASWRDLVWDVIGTAVGLALGWAVDRLLSERRCGTEARAGP